MRASPNSRTSLLCACDVFALITDLDEGSEDEESSSEQTAAKEKQSARLAGVLGAFL